jgi:hypothetical protein
MVRNSDSTKVIHGFKPAAHPSDAAHLYNRARVKGVDADYIVKIDDQKTFNSIYKKKVTSITAKDITDATLKSYNSWFNRPELKDIVGKNKSNFKWVVDHRGAVEALIRARFEKPDAGRPNEEKRFMSSLRGGLEALAHLLLAYDKNAFREYTRRIWVEGTQIQKIIDEEKGESLLTEEELRNHITYPQFVRMREKKYEEWVLLSKQYDDRPIKYDKGSSKRRMANLHHLLIAVNTYIPPLRRQWPKMKLHTGKEEPEGETKQNYLWEKNPGEFSIVITTKLRTSERPITCPDRSWSSQTR